MVSQTTAFRLLGELLNFLLNLRDSQAELMLVIALQELNLRFQALVLLFERCQLCLQEVYLGLKVCDDVESRSAFLLDLRLDLGKAGSGETLPRSPLK